MAKCGQCDCAKFVPHFWKRKTCRECFHAKSDHSDDKNDDNSNNNNNDDDNTKTPAVTATTAAATTVTADEAAVAVVKKSARSTSVDSEAAHSEYIDRIISTHASPPQAPNRKRRFVLPTSGSNSNNTAAAAADKEQAEKARREREEKQRVVSERILRRKQAMLSSSSLASTTSSDEDDAERRKRRQDEVSAKLERRRSMSRLTPDVSAVAAELVECVALYAYQQHGTTDIGLRAYEVVQLVAQESDEWSRVRRKSTGEEGQVPTRYVANVLCVAEALHSFTPTDAADGQQLALQQGDHVLVFEKIDDHWWRGVIGERGGIFPVNHVRVSVARPRQQQQQQQQSQSPPRAAQRQVDSTSSVASANVGDVGSGGDIAKAHEVSDGKAETVGTGRQMDGEDEEAGAAAVAAAAVVVVATEVEAEVEADGKAVEAESSVVNEEAAAAAAAEEEEEKQNEEDRERIRRKRDEEAAAEAAEAARIAAETQRKQDEEAKAAAAAAEAARVAAETQRKQDEEAKAAAEAAEAARVAAETQSKQDERNHVVTNKDAVAPPSSSSSPTPSRPPVPPPRRSISRSGSQIVTVDTIHGLLHSQGHQVVKKQGLELDDGDDLNGMPSDDDSAATVEHNRLKSNDNEENYDDLVDDTASLEAALDAVFDGGSSPSHGDTVGDSAPEASSPAAQPEAEAESEAATTTVRDDGHKSATTNDDTTTGAQQPTPAPVDDVPLEEAMDVARRRASVQQQPSSSASLQQQQQQQQQSARRRPRFFSLYGYQQRSTSDITVEAFEELDLVEKKSDDWWHMRCASDADGLVPARYVMEVLCEVKAVHDYTPADDAAFHLPLRTNDRVKVFEKIDANWWRGACDQKAGIFPVSYTVPVDADAATGNTAAAAATATTSTTDKATPSMAANGDTNSSSSSSSSSKVWLRAIYAYNPGVAGQLSLMANERLEFVSQAAEGWYHARKGHVEGLVPSSYVVKIADDNSPAAAATAAPAVTLARALFDYTATGGDQLAFKAGAVIKVANANPTVAWWTGELDGRTGILPKNFVSVLTAEQQAAHTASQQRADATGEVVATVAYQSADNFVTKAGDALVQLGAANGEWCRVRHVDPKKEPNEGLVPVDNVTRVLMRVNVVFPYEPQEPEQLAINIGDVVFVVRKVDDHWWDGYVGRQRGVFPRSYVTELKVPTLAAMAAANPQDATRMLSAQLGIKFHSGPRSRRATVLVAKPNASEQRQRGLQID